MLSAFQHHPGDNSDHARLLPTTLFVNPCTRVCNQSSCIRLLPFALHGGAIMKVLNAVTSLLGDLSKQVKSSAASGPTSAVKRYGYPSPIRRIRGARLVSIRQAYFRMYPLCEHCKACGIVAIATELDHIVALVNGGADFDTDEGLNRQGLCTPHHAAKTAQDMGYEYSPKLEVGLDGWPIAQEPIPMATGTTHWPSPMHPHHPTDLMAQDGEGGSKVQVPSDAKPLCPSILLNSHKPRTP